MSTPKKPAKLRPDAAEIAFRVMQEATGQGPKTDPANREKNPEAVKRGTKGGAKGGKERAAKMTPAARRDQAVKSARARWDQKS